MMIQPKSFGGKVSGAASDDICNCSLLAREAWGKRSEDKHSSLIAMPYLWRRFGPPFFGSDEHKDLCAYYLTTGDTRVFLWLHLNASGLYLSVGYVASVEIGNEIRKPHGEWIAKLEKWWFGQHPEIDDWDQKTERMYITDTSNDIILDEAKKDIGEPPTRQDPEKWRETGGIITHVNQVLYDAMKELLEPVYVRDVAINIFGRCEDSEESAEHSKYAGLGISRESMDNLLKEE